MAIQTVGVIGLGTMVAGIVEVFAKGGLTVVGVEMDEELAARGRGIVEKSTGRAVSKGKLSEEDHAAILGRITTTSDFAALAPCDLVVEAAPERMEIKRDVFGRLDEVCRKDAVLASNTSSLSLTQIAAGTKHPERVVGMHFFNPAPVLKLVEVITTVTTAPEVVEAVRTLATDLGKKPVVIGDRAGFVGNYLLFSYLNRANQLLESGVASAQDIDTAMKVGAGFPMGPMTLMDLIGLDVCHAINHVIHDATGSSVFRPTQLEAGMVAAKQLGRKTGRGFFAYGEGAQAPVTTEPDAAALGHVVVIGRGDLAGSLAAALDGSGVDVERLEDTSGDLSAVGRADVVIEALGEEDVVSDDDVEAGEEPALMTAEDLFAALDDLVGDDTVLVSTTAVTLLDAACEVEHDELVIGFELHDETPNGRLAEIVRLSSTSEKAVQTGRVLAATLGVVPAVCLDREGRIVDALVFPYLNEAVKMLDCGYATVEDMNTAMKFGCGYPQGPFEMLESLGGPAQALLAQQDLYLASGDPALAPSPLLVEKALLGRDF